ncbi:MAG: hypothetical protein KDC34_04505 [Saprospiraceae bacterium]|nr:hypothetical protein [Saprospiraceae bacterium]
MKKMSLLAVLFLTAISSYAQIQVGLSYMDEIWQGSLNNPANQSEHRLVVILPSIGNTLSFTGPTYGDAIVEQNGTNVLDVNQIISRLEDRNQLREQFQIGTVGFSIQFANLQVGFHHTTKFDAFLDYPKELPTLIWKGNAQYIGETIPLGNNLQLSGYHEVGVSGALRLGKLELGARLKYLSGIGSLSTDQAEASLYTDPEIYQLTFNADYRLRTASSLDYRAFNDFDINYSFGQISIDKLFSGNAGIGIDLGANLDLGRLKVGASVVDMGGINWKKDVKTYTTNGSFTYEGLDIAQALTGDSVSFEQALDTLAQIFDFKESAGSYKTRLPTRAFVTAGFNLTNMWEVGAVLAGEFYQENFNPAASIYGKAKIGPWLRLGANYTIANQTYDNLGLSAVARLGPVQVYAMTDNIISAFQAENSQYFNFLAGVNLAFGKKNAADVLEGAGNDSGVRF